MKINFEIDCTPLEARQFLGLPDVQPMQARMMAELETNMLREAQRFSPETLMRFWFSTMPQSAEWVRDLMGSMLPPGTKSSSSS